MLEQIIGLISIFVGIGLAVFIARYELRLMMQITHPRMRMAFQCSHILKSELEISTHPDIRIFGGDIVLTCLKANKEAIEPRMTEIKKALAEFPDVISLEGDDKHPEIILIEPPRAGKRDEKARPHIVLQPTLQ